MLQSQKLVKPTSHSKYVWIEFKIPQALQTLKENPLLEICKYAMAIGNLILKSIKSPSQRTFKISNVLTDLFLIKLIIPLVICIVCTCNFFTEKRRLENYSPPRGHGCRPELVGQAHI